jgi:hypothetical protein
MKKILIESTVCPVNPAKNQNEWFRYIAKEMRKIKNIKTIKQTA